MNTQPTPKRPRPEILIAMLKAWTGWALFIAALSVAAILIGW